MRHHSILKILASLKIEKYDMSRNKRQGRWLLEYRDETSQFDHEGEWQPGSDCYTRYFRFWIPNAIRKDDHDGIQRYLEYRNQ